jgi:hypothetical protein
MKKFFPNGKLWLMGMLLLLAVTGAPALAWPITLANSSFEADTLGTEGWNDRVAGWDLTGSSGTWNPGTGVYPGGAPDGANVAWTWNASLSQTLSAVVQANHHYTLEAYVGKVSIEPVHYYVELVAQESGAVLAAVEGDATYLTFNLVKVNFTATDQHLGEHLKVVIGNTDFTEIDFDNVTLTSSSAPVPSSLLLLGSGLLGLAGYLRRKKT